MNNLPPPPDDDFLPPNHHQVNWNRLKQLLWQPFPGQQLYLDDREEILAIKKDDSVEIVGYMQAGRCQLLFLKNSRLLGQNQRKFPDTDGPERSNSTVQTEQCKTRPQQRIL